MCLTLVLMQTVVVKQAATLTLSSICSIAALSALTAGAIWFLELCKEKGMLLRRPYAVLTFYLWYKTRPRYIWYVAKYTRPKPGTCKSDPVYALHTKPRRTVYTWLYKVSGGCVWCFGTWLATFFYLVIAPEFGLTNLQLLKLWFPFVGSNYMFMELINKIRS